MRTRTWVPAAAALLLVVGVLATRGGTAAAEDDLLPPAAEPPPSAPSPEPSADVVQAVAVEANGIPGMRLGTDGRELLSPFGGGDVASGGPLQETPGGCATAYEPPGSTEQNWGAAAWVVDGLVSAVVLSRWDTSGPVRPVVTTWLGPTLGSPVRAASELVGARTTVERPFGHDGPAVTVVVVPGDGVEVVYSDATYDQASVLESDRGRVTTLEVRQAGARPCAMQDVQASYRTGADPEEVAVSLGPGGLDVAPIGTPVDVVRALPGVGPHPGVTDACETFHLTTEGGGSVRLTVLDGVVVSAHAYGTVPTDLGVAPGDGVAEVQAAYPELLTPGEAVVPGTAEVVMGDRVLGLDLWPAVAWVPEVELPVTGGPVVVESLSVRDAAVEVSRLC